MRFVWSLTVLFVLVGCGGSANVYTTGDTVDISKFRGVLTLDANSATGDLKNNPILHKFVESKSVEALETRYGSVASFAALLPTATPEELKMTADEALKGRGYTHLLTAAVNPVDSFTNTGNRYNNVTGRNETTSSTYYSMDISCTVYRLSDGKAISHANADAYMRDKNIFSWAIDQSVIGSEKYEDRLRLGIIFSCDEALKAVTTSQDVQ